MRELTIENYPGARTRERTKEGAVQVTRAALGAQLQILAVS